MKIYLAGKIDDVAGGWRDALVGSDWDTSFGEQRPHWKLTRQMDDDGYVGTRVSVPWPTEPNRHVLKLHEYVGPYRTDMVRGENFDWKYFGEFHGSLVEGGHGQTNGEEDGVIVSECLAAIRRADMVFAYINRPDCFGTLAEIGVARTLDVFTVLAIEQSAEWDWSDYWFVTEMVDGTVGPDEAIDISDRPSEPVKWNDEASMATWRDWWDRRDREHKRIQSMMRDAIVLWSARPERRPQLAIVQTDQTTALTQGLREAAQSFSQISRWSADPRVRDEAQRMLRRITG